MKYLQSVLQYLTSLPHCEEQNLTFWDSKSVYRRMMLSSIKWTIPVFYVAVLTCLYHSDLCATDHRPNTGDVPKAHVLVTTAH